ncbi:hypothetical protein JX265_004678 [Neoarthrinium moseri]|uniref:Uncharacterized protein n=1 Tax=Neoarthrinium moseri TaxID=1658444 RepID=A0A9P9WPM3_9PEZI|nr:uncharacterized protein JN550_003820 [Neoarthrinium moseri]KAI1841592.1 hypothetical protein JX266_012245 [Neoarthrinium moseri]KAI1872946.1 hypothetical protein JN550_003820 [Neoarthrinium moseri]KAI1874470.1 hypothetical protein JX265_004678 [Neoarthrinium moseri]
MATAGENPSKPIKFDPDRLPPKWPTDHPQTLEQYYGMPIPADVTPFLRSTSPEPEPSPAREPEAAAPKPRGPRQGPVDWTADPYVFQTRGAVFRTSAATSRHTREFREEQRRRRAGRNPRPMPPYGSWTGYKLVTGWTSRSMAPAPGDGVPRMANIEPKFDERVRRLRDSKAEGRQREREERAARGEEVGPEDAEQRSLDCLALDPVPADDGLDPAGRPIAFGQRGGAGGQHVPKPNGVRAIPLTIWVLYWTFVVGLGLTLFVAIIQGLTPTM